MTTCHNRGNAPAFRSGAKYFYNLCENEGRNVTAFFQLAFFPPQCASHSAARRVSRHSEFSKYLERLLQTFSNSMLDLCIWQLINNMRKLVVVTTSVHKFFSPNTLSAKSLLDLFSPPFPLIRMNNRFFLLSISLFNSSACRFPKSSCCVARDSFNISLKNDFRFQTISECDFE